MNYSSFFEEFLLSAGVGGKVLVDRIGGYVPSQWSREPGGRRRQ